MISIKIPMTAQTPSGFVMPISVPPLAGVGMTTGATVCTAPTLSCAIGTWPACPRQGTHPGTTAWSPPTC